MTKSFGWRFSMRQLLIMMAVLSILSAVLSFYLRHTISVGYVSYLKPGDVVDVTTEQGGGVVEKVQIASVEQAFPQTIVTLRVSLSQKLELSEQDNLYIRPVHE